MSLTGSRVPARHDVMWRADLKRVLVLLAGLSILFSGQPSASSEGTKSDRFSSHGVRQKHWVDYNVQSCGGYTAYDMVRIRWKWKRSRTDRYVENATLYWAGEGRKCNNDPWIDSWAIDDLPACFSCKDNYSTKVYRLRLSKNLSFPYLTAAWPNPFLGTKLTGYVTARRGTLDNLCTRIVFFGSGMDC